LSHPNVVTVHDCNEVNGVHFLVMELLEGTDLAKLVHEKGPLPVGAACDYIRQAALGLQHAHEQGLVHRDVKPHNLLLTREGVVKVTDLGLARTAHTAQETAVSPKLTRTGAVMGTADYLAPEQAKDAHAVDIRADIYSLGCTLYHLLAGEPPFDGGTLANKIAAHLFMEAAALDQRRPDLPAELAAVVQRMMAKKPDDRYSTPVEVARALMPFVSTTASGTTPEVSRAPGTGAVMDTFEAWKSPGKTLADADAGQPRRWRRWQIGVLAGLFVATVMSAGFLLVVLFSRPRHSPTSVAVAPTESSASATEPALPEPSVQREEEPRHAEAVTEDDLLARLSPPAPPIMGRPPVKKKDPPPRENIFLDLGNKVTLELVPIPAGTFQMGAPVTDGDAYIKDEYVGDDSGGHMTETPQHEVTISKEFYLGKYPVTLGQFAQFYREKKYRTEPERDKKGGVGYNPATRQIIRLSTNFNWNLTGFSQTPDHPVVNVTWNDAQEFCAWLSKRLGKNVRLPTEAEWEYAARAGTETRYFTGNEPASLRGFANIADQTLKNQGIIGSATWLYFDFNDNHVFTSPVGSFKPNPWGLYDMTGNVFQWCADGKRTYEKQAEIDPSGPTDDKDKKLRIARGGAWTAGPRDCRCSYRREYSPSRRNLILGFRVMVRPD
jgi:formylglycine-generating enzyme required for sulfatase activity